MLRYSKITVCNDSLAVFCHFWPSKQSHLSFDRKKFPQHMYSIWQYRLSIDRISNRWTKKEILYFLRWNSTVKDNPQLSDLKGPGTSKLDWRYFEHNKVDRNELQIRKNLHKGTGTKMTEKLNNLTEEKLVIFFPVPLCKLLRTWSSFLSTLLCSKYLQSNFEVPGSCGSLSWELSCTVIY